MLCSSSRSATIKLTKNIPRAYRKNQMGTLKLTIQQLQTVNIDTPAALHRSRPGSNRGSSACKADVITSTLRDPLELPNAMNQY